jgi:hypothetical protein
MAGLLESVASFQQRVTTLGLEDTWPKFIEKGWTTYASFSFSVNYVPGAADDKVFMSELVGGLLEAGDKRAPALRRLHYEAYTLFVTDLRSKMSRSENDAPRKLVVPEREARRQRLIKRLPGFDFTGELDVSHCLVDRCVQMWEDDTLSYLPWDLCSMRSQELRGKRTIKELRTDNKGFVREHEVPTILRADLTSDLRIKNTLQRRGAAMDMANLLTFETHERLVRKYMEVMLDDAPRGYARIDLDQVRRADEVLFNLMVDRTREGIRAGGDGVMPLDKVLPDAMQDPKFFWALNPLPLASGSQALPVLEPPADRKRKREASKERKNREHKERNRAETRDKRNKNQDGAKPKAPPKGKGKGRPSDHNGPNMPKELQGMAHEYKGQAICYGYNMREGCAFGAKCRKGLHCCCVHGCGGAHPMSEHR